MADIETRATRRRPQERRGLNGEGALARTSSLRENQERPGYEFPGATGAVRAKARLIAKMKAIHAIHTDRLANPPSRQVLRARQRAPIYFTASDGSRRALRGA